MKTEVFQTKEWNDLIFEGRNKDYGAYVLRMEHERNMAAGLITAFGFFGLLFLIGLALSKYTGRNIVPEIPPQLVDFNDFKLIDVIKPKVEDIKPDAEAPKVKTEKFTSNMKVVADAKAQNFADNEKLNNNNVSNISNEKGNENPIDIQTQGNGDNNGKPEVIESNENKIFPITALESQPEFPGGEIALNKFLATHIKYTNEAKEIGKEGNVFLTFVIDENGKPVNVAIARGLCCGLNEEAIKAIQSMPNWIPGKMGNKAVKVMYSLRVVFKLN